MPVIKSFIPAARSPFDEWQLNFVTQVDLFKVDWDFTTKIDDEWKLLTQTAAKKKMRWDTINAIIATNNFKPSDVAELKKARKDYEFGKKDLAEDTSLRLFITRYIRNNPSVTFEQKRIIGITLPDDIPTPISDSNAKISGNELISKVRSMSHLIHYNTVNYAGQLTKAKGEGVDQIEVFIAFTAGDVKVAPPLSEFKYDGEVKRGLYTRKFDASQEGLRAWYYARLRIKGKTITFGPPSDIWGAIIP